jgi:hypothetical protein
MQPTYNLPEYIIAIEFLLVFIVIILTYLLKLIYFIKNKREKRISKEMRVYLNHIINTNQSFSKQKFKNTWKQLNLILPILDELDKHTNTNHGKAVFRDLVHEVMLPLARREAHSRNWVGRLHASQVFTLGSEAPDPAIITTLVKDPVPLVAINALNAALIHANASAINFMITKIAKERRLSQTISLQAFRKANAEINKIIDERLASETDPYVRETCYNILLECPEKTSRLNTEADLESTNLELKIAAIKFIAHVESQHAVPRLKRYLSDDAWEVKVVTIHCLEQLEAKSVIPELVNCLRDPHWWVRLNAAQALKSFGAEGIHVLKSQKPQDDKYAYEMAQHVLAIK